MDLSRPLIGELPLKNSLNSEIKTLSEEGTLKYQITLMNGPFLIRFIEGIRITDLKTRGVQNSDTIPILVTQWEMLLI